MITRKVRTQLLLLLAIAVIGISYTGARYAGLDRLFGAGGYRVSVRLADAGGLEPNAEVAYRGVAVGQVDGLRLVPGGVSVAVRISASAPPIPASSVAVVTDRSAIGEQNIDLEPPNATGPFLIEGSVIQQSHTTLPPVPAEVLTNLDRLAQDVPTGSLHTTITELGRGFAGTGPSLRSLIDGAGTFVQTAQQHLPQTVGLLNTASTVLHTQQDEISDLLTFSQGLDQIAAQLKSSDPDLRTVIATTPEVADQLRGVLHDSGPALSQLLVNTVTLSRITKPRTDNLETLLIAYPMMNDLGPTLAPDSKAGRLAFVLPFYDPPPCTKGYQRNPQRQATDFSPVRTPPELRCTEPKTSQTEVRGSQNAPNHGGW